MWVWCVCVGVVCVCVGVGVGVCKCIHTHIVWCSEIGSLTSPKACNSGAPSDVREPISLHQAVHTHLNWYSPVLLLRGRSRLVSTLSRDLASLAKKKEMKKANGRDKTCCQQQDRHKMMRLKAVH